jgi:Flp pilus assembly secretin CpaC
VDEFMKIKFMKRSATGLILTILCSTAYTATAQASDLLRVFTNHARILKFETPISSVIVGNSDVADVTVSDPQTVILTGKSYGSTNLVILDGDGNAIVDKRIVVSVDEENTVRIFRQVERSVLACSPICEEQTASTE